MLIPVSDYRPAWNEYRRLRNKLLILFFPYMLVVGMLFLRAKPLLNSLIFIVVFAWTIWLFNTAVRFYWWRCPRCGKCFAARWWYTKGFFARRCVHCGYLNTARATAYPGQPQSHCDQGRCLVTPLLRSLRTARFLTVLQRSPNSALQRNLWCPACLVANSTSIEAAVL